MSNPNRVPEGSPEGGQFASGGARGESSDVSLSSPTLDIEGFSDDDLGFTGGDEVDLDALSKRSIEVRYARGIDELDGEHFTYSGLAPRENTLNPSDVIDVRDLLKQARGDRNRSVDPGLSAAKLDSVYVSDSEGRFRFAAVERASGKLVAVAEAPEPAQINEGDSDEVRRAKSDMSSAQRREMVAMTPKEQQVYALSHGSPNRQLRNIRPLSGDEARTMNRGGGYHTRDDIDAGIYAGAHENPIPAERAHLIRAINAGSPDQMRPDLRHAMLNASPDDIAKTISTHVRKYRDPRVAGQTWGSREAPTTLERKLIGLSDRARAKRFGEGVDAGLSPDDLSGDHSVTDLSRVRSVLDKAPGRTSKLYASGGAAKRALDNGWTPDEVETWGANATLMPREFVARLTREHGMGPQQFQAMSKRLGGAMQPEDLAYELDGPYYDS